MSRSTNPFTFQGFDATTELFRGAARTKKAQRLQQDQMARGQGGAPSGKAIPAFLQRLNRVSAKSPEAMVRITGAAKGGKHVKEHLAYITRNGKIEAVNERGEAINGREAVKEFAQEWMIGSPKQRQNRAPDTRNLMLSMPEGTDPQKVLRAAKTFADKTFGGERMYALVLHTDQAHPHVHLTVKTRGYDGKNLNPRKADLQAWRESFAHELRALGVAAEATPRRSRGVVKKPRKQAVFHMERAHAAGKRTVRPEVQLRKWEEALQEFKGVDRPKARPWEAKIAERQEKVRNAWKGTADVLAKHPDPNAQALAKQIRQFIKEMPPVQTERQHMVEQIRGAARARGRGADRS